jgi:hypothetical protein
MATRSRRPFLTFPIALLLTACGSTTPSPTSAPQMQSVHPAASSETPASSAANPSTTATADQTDTDWGRIWDGVPAGFPRYPGSTPDDDSTDEPASARYAIDSGDAGTIAMWFQDALEQATFSTIGMNGPGEDGGYVIDSVGEGDCQVHTTITPLGSMTFVAVWYGAGCPSA